MTRHVWPSTLRWSRVRCAVCGRRWPPTGGEGVEESRARGNEAGAWGERRPDGAGGNMGRGKGLGEKREYSEFEGDGKCGRWGSHYAICRRSSSSLSVRYKEMAGVGFPARVLPVTFPPPPSLCLRRRLCRWDKALHARSSCVLYSPPLPLTFLRAFLAHPGSSHI